MTNLLYSALISAIIATEQDPKLKWDTPATEHGAEGAAQIREIWRRDFNRIMRERGSSLRYSRADTHNEKYTKWAMNEWFCHYAKAFEKKYEREATLRECSWFFRFGFEATCAGKLEQKVADGYWKRVEAELKKGEGKP